MYEKLYNYITENTVSVVFVACAITVCILLLLCFRSNVQSNGNGASTVREQLSQAQSTTSQLTTGISQAESTTREIRQTSQELGATINSIQGTLYQSGDAISDCEQILRKIRQRGKSKEIKN